MKAELVKIKDFKVIHNLEAEIKGKNVLLLGDNGVGKSSFIQFIEIALGKQKNIPADVQGGGEVTFDKDGKKITFKVDFRDGKPYIKVKGEGVAIDNKKSAIAELVGALDFDIDEFVDLSKTTAGQKKQVEIFKSFLPMEVQQELKKHEATIAADYADRAELNKDIKKLEGSTQLHPLYNEVFNLDKYQPVNIDTVYAELKEVQAHNQKINDFKNKVEQVKKDVESDKKEIADLQAKIEALQARIDLNEHKAKEGDAYLEKNPLRDISSFEETIRTATEANDKYNKAQALKADMKKIETLKEEAGTLTAKIDSSRQAISDTIKQMDSPVQGLTYEDDKLVYNGVPVTPDNLSTSEIMELGIRLKMAENPELGILFIQRGESLGAERLKLIQEIAEKAGWQIIMEQVERGKKELHVEIMEG